MSLLVVPKIERSLDFWSVPQQLLVIQNSSGPVDTALPDVVVAGLPDNARVTRVEAIFKFRAIQDISGLGNLLAGAQSIQVRVSTPPGDWANAVNFADTEFTLAALAREGGDAMLGDVDLSATVNGNGTYNFQWTGGLAGQDNLQFNDLQVGLRVWFK